MPDQLGRYSLIRRLAYGGMAEVWLGELQSSDGYGRKVAIKRIHPHLAEDTDFIDMFRSEARLGRLLEHANIVATLELGEVDKTWFLAMEYVQGPSLAQVIRHAQLTGIPLSVGMVLEILVQLTNALDYAHTATDDQGRPLRLIHRDLKPANVLIDRSGLVKLTDFGIARAVTNIKVTNTTGKQKGTMPYMAPEQARGDKELDARADLYALGLIAFELLTLQRLHQDSDNIPGMLRIMNGDVEERLPLLYSKAPHAVSSLIHSLLQPQAEGRPPSAEALLLELEPLLTQAQSAGSTRRALTQWLKASEGQATQNGLPVRPPSKPSSGANHNIASLGTAPPTLDKGAQRLNDAADEPPTDPGVTRPQRDPRAGTENLPQDGMTAERTILSDPTRRISTPGETVVALPSQRVTDQVPPPSSEAAAGALSSGPVSPPPVQPALVPPEQPHPGNPASIQPQPPVSYETVVAPAGSVATGSASPAEMTSTSGASPARNLLAGAVVALLFFLSFGLWKLRPGEPPSRVEGGAAPPPATSAEGVQPGADSTSGKSSPPSDKTNQPEAPDRSQKAGTASTKGPDPMEGPRGPSSKLKSSQESKLPVAAPKLSPTPKRPVLTAEPPSTSAEPAPPSTPSPEQTEPGRLKANSEPPSKVYLGSRLLGETPLLGIPLPAGTHRLRFVSASGQELEREIQVHPGETVRVTDVRFR